MALREPINCGQRLRETGQGEAAHGHALERKAMFKPESRGAQQRKPNPLLAVKFKVVPYPLALSAGLLRFPK